MSTLMRLYRAAKSGPEECFYFDLTKKPKKPQDAGEQLMWLLREPGMSVSPVPFYRNEDVVEIGPRIAMETTYSSNAVSICSRMHVRARRVERSLRYPHGGNREAVLKAHLDPMTQEVYPEPLTRLFSRRKPKPVIVIPFLERGEETLREANAKMNLGWDEDDIRFYARVFRQIARDPTDAEGRDLSNCNSDHSRHWRFQGPHCIDGVWQQLSMLELVKRTWKKNPGRSILAFNDNSGVMRGQEVDVLLPLDPSTASAMGMKHLLLHMTITAETHNEPTKVSPFWGALTGPGGRMRDSLAVRRGALFHAGIVGICTGNLFIPGYEIPGEEVGGEEDIGVASALRVVLEGSAGAFRYANEFGEPLIGGFFRTYEQNIVRRGQSGDEVVRYGWRKPVLYTAGVGQIPEQSLRRREPEKGMLVVRIGTPIYPVGVGGGAASSTDPTDRPSGLSKEDERKLNFAAVQRGSPERGNRNFRVVAGCVALLDDNPIELITDQGAGGMFNMLKELMSPLGGTIDIGKVNLGDPTMDESVIGVAESQESFGLLVRPKNLKRLQEFCEREGVLCEVLGKLDGSGQFRVINSRAGGKVIEDLPLREVLSDTRRKRFTDTRMPYLLQPLHIPAGLSVRDAFRMTLRRPSQGSKRNFTTSVDRSVSGRVVLQPCVGPRHVPVADAGVFLSSYWGNQGVASATGEQPIMMLIDTPAGARMAMAEMFSNIACVKITSMRDVACRFNEMWSAKIKGEGARLYDCVKAVTDFALAVRTHANGGKDSTSMVCEVDGTRVVGPGQFVVVGAAPVPDVRKLVTPDFKGNGTIGFIDIAKGKRRMGGTPFAQALGMIGNECADIDDIPLFVRAFEAVQELVDRGLITAYHDFGGDGLGPTFAEMCIAGNCGAQMKLPKRAKAFEELFSGEMGMLFEYRGSAAPIREVMEKHGVPWSRIGRTSRKLGSVGIRIGNKIVFDSSVTELWGWWEETATALHKLQSNPETALEEHRSFADRREVKYWLSFDPPTRLIRRPRPNAPKALVLREWGANGDSEMKAVCQAAGFEVTDAAMEDLIRGRMKDLDPFQFLIFPGGFSNADVFGAGKGWAAAIRFNPSVRRMFDRFFDRQDTLSLGVCNGCQVGPYLGQVPLRGLPEEKQPRFMPNRSSLPGKVRLESRLVAVKILPSQAVLFKDMQGSILPIWSVHGEGNLVFTDSVVRAEVARRKLVPLVYVGPEGKATEQYPYNPNGSQGGWAGLCSENWRNLIMMPHSERMYRPEIWPYLPESWRGTSKGYAWMQMYVNAFEWCKAHR